MFPLPFCRFILVAELPPADVVARIRARIVLPTPAEQTAFGIEAFFRRLEGQPTPQYFRGVADVTGLTFRVSRFITYQNSFLPVIFGTASPSGNGTILSLYARPPWFATVFTLAWLGSTCALLFGQHASSFPWLVRVGMPVFAVLLNFGAFIPELLATRRALEALIAPTVGQSEPEA